MVEVLLDYVCDVGFVHSGFGPIGNRTHHSPVSERLPLRYAWCDTFHRSHNSGIGIQQFSMVSATFLAGLAASLNNVGDTIRLFMYLRVPLSTIFGRRFVLLLSSLLCVGSYCWKATATSYSSFMGAAILTGFAAAPAEVERFQ